MPHLVSITHTPLGDKSRPADFYLRKPLKRAILVTGRGIEGDSKAKAGKRQLNVMLAETVAQLSAEGYRTAPGELGEQLVVAGLAPEEAKPGVRLRIGDSAVIELGSLREPCSRFAHIQQHSIEEATGRIGYMARVLQGGAIEAGSPVTICAEQTV